MRRSKRTGPEKRLKLAVLIRDDFKCIYCGLDIRNVSREKATVDHITSVRDGGANHHENLVACCAGCNISKGSENPMDWASNEAIMRISDCITKPIDKYYMQADQLICLDQEGLQVQSNGKVSKLSMLKKHGNQGILRHQDK